MLCSQTASQSIVLLIQTCFTYKHITAAQFEMSACDFKTLFFEMTIHAKHCQWGAVENELLCIFSLSALSMCGDDGTKVRRTLHNGQQKIMLIKYYNITIKRFQPTCRDSGHTCQQGSVSLGRRGKQFLSSTYMFKWLLKPHLFSLHLLLYFFNMLFYCFYLHNTTVLQHFGQHL